MGNRMVSITLSLSIFLLLLATWFMIGCEQGNSPVAPDQESLLAPGKGNPHNDDDAPGPEPKGKAKGNPHVNDNPQPDVKGNVPRHKGAVKVPLLDANGLNAGWAKANTSANDDDDPDLLEEELDAQVVDATGNILIVVVHFDDGLEGTFDIRVIIHDNDGNEIRDGIFGSITTNHKGKGTQKVKIPLDITAGDGDDFIVVEVIVDGYETGEFSVSLKKQGPEEVVD